MPAEVMKARWFWNGEWRDADVTVYASPGSA